MPQPRVVVVATTIGYDGVPHAGGTYMRALSDLMAPLTDITVLVPGSRANREAAHRPGAPQKVIPLGLEPASSLLGKVANRASLRADARWRRRDPGMPYLPLLVGLARSPEARRAVREADVIDLQWSDSIRLVHLLRRLNPRAKIVGTFHDVMSQSFAREPQETRPSAATGRRSRDGPGATSDGWSEPSTRFSSSAKRTSSCSGRLGTRVSCAHHCQRDNV